MKCPKCGYLGFESSDRCRNCGYDFSLAPPAPAAFDLAIDHAVEQPRPALDLDRVFGAPEPEPPADLPLFAPSSTETNPRPVSARLADDAPLISAPSRPRAPLGVRRATPEVRRARVQPRHPAPVDDTLFETPPVAVIGQAFADTRRAAAPQAEAPASSASRIVAGLLDVSLLSALDVVVLYFTLRLCGLTPAEIVQLPPLPLAAFFLLLNGGYFVAFTAVGGQSIGKMALGIKVITQEDSSVPIGRATLRTLAYLASALPLGAGFLFGLLSHDRLALHDRLAHTRVIRPS